MADIFDIFKKLEKNRADVAAQPISHLVVGLGNPGREYEKTRHNAGFRALDILADQLGTKVDKLNQTERKKALEAIIQHPLLRQGTEVIPVSSLKKEGREVVLAKIEALL